MRNERFKWDGRLIKFIELIIDLGLVFMGFYTVLLMDHAVDLNHTFFEQGRDLLLSNAFFLVSAFIFFRIYGTSAIERSYVATMFSVFFALLLSNIASVVAVFFLPDVSYSRMTFLYIIWIQYFYLLVWKYIFSRFVNKRNNKTAIIIGIKHEAEKLAMKLIAEKRHFIKLEQICIEETDSLSDRTYTLMKNVDQVFVTPNVHERIKERVISYCLGIKFKDAVIVPKTYHVGLLNSKAYQVADVLTLKVESLHISLEGQFLKRTFDLAVSIMALIILFPVLLVTAIIIKLYDGGPVFFRQVRVTKENTKFNILKFRSMIKNAEKHTGAIQATEKDPRITPFGKLIRATRLDELPQLINVLKGDMSIVGPRALRIEEVEEFTSRDSDFAYRAHVKAGITGLAQIMGKYGTSSDDKLRLDLVYIRNQSFINDLILIAQTAKIVFDRNSSKGISDEIPFNEFVKYYGYKLENDANCIKIKKVV